MILYGNYIIFSCPVGQMAKKCLLLKSSKEWCKNNYIYAPAELVSLKEYFGGFFRVQELPFECENKTVEECAAFLGDPVLVKIKDDLLQYLFYAPEHIKENELPRFLDGAEMSEFVKREFHLPEIGDASSLQSYMEEFGWI